MVPLRISPFWQIRLWYAVLLSVCFCSLGLVSAGCGQSDYVRLLIATLKDPEPSGSFNGLSKAHNSSPRCSIYQFMLRGLMVWPERSELCRCFRRKGQHQIKQ